MELSPSLSTIEEAKQNTQLLRQWLWAKIELWAFVLSGQQYLMSGEMRIGSSVFFCLLASGARREPYHRPNGRGVGTFPYKK